jgi:hypothetical protein
MLDFNVISSQKGFVKILCLGLKDASKCQHCPASCPQFGASLQLRSNVGPPCIMPCLKHWINWSNSLSLESVLYVTLLLPWNYAKQIYTTLLCAHLYKFMKVAKLAMVQIMGSIEKDKFFSTLTFMKTRLWDILCDHLVLVVCMFAISLLHCFNFFPYNDAITS